MFNINETFQIKITKLTWDSLICLILLKMLQKPLKTNIHTQYHNDYKTFLEQYRNVNTNGFDLFHKIAHLPWYGLGV